jgi:hypothetical protein
MDSLSVAIAPPSRGRTALTIQRHFAGRLRRAARDSMLLPPCVRTVSRVITITETRDHDAEIGDHDHRNG